MKKLKLYLILIGFCLIGFLSTDVHAHFLWLNAHDYTPKANKAAKFSIGWGHAFYNPVGDIFSGKELMEKIYLIAPEGKRIETNALDEFRYESTSKLPSGTYIAIVNRKEGFSTKTKTGYLRQSKQGLKDVIHSRYIGMYGKAIINVGNPGRNKSLSIPIGTSLEFIPLTDPKDLKVGDYFKFQLLYHGKGVTEYINSAWAGFSYDNAWAFSTRTDKKGFGEIKILSSGVWVIKANHKVKYPDQTKADEYSYTSSLTFEIR